ncbi:hypothetical protein EYF80_019084 [Liparis tanakae]|uniref:Uncharacterized protein n=1 Tax=Liparis tanakae TaxID=230148 RepID=A0A4Z2HY59_9TELE|nr:hypothetical protein EYF80_019084 [Liparis tanakae]
MPGVRRPSAQQHSKSCSAAVSISSAPWWCSGMGRMWNSWPPAAPFRQSLDAAEDVMLHNFQVVWIHEAHKLGVFQGVQQQLGDTSLVLLGCHLTHFGLQHKLVLPGAAQIVLDRLQLNFDVLRQRVIFSNSYSVLNLNESSEGLLGQFIIELFLEDLEL